MRGIQSFRLATPEELMNMGMLLSKKHLTKIVTYVKPDDPHCETLGSTQRYMGTIRHGDADPSADTSSFSELAKKSNPYSNIARKRLDHLKRNVDGSDLTQGPVLSVLESCISNTGAKCLGWLGDGKNDGGKQMTFEVILTGTECCRGLGGANGEFRYINDASGMSAFFDNSWTVQHSEHVKKYWLGLNGQRLYANPDCLIIICQPWNPNELPWEIMHLPRYNTDPSAFDACLSVFHVPRSIEIYTIHICFLTFFSISFFSFSFSSSIF
jgi:hypothetical protein